VYIPEYSITNQTLKHIADIEYSKAIIDEIPLLQNFENRLKNESLVERISCSLSSCGNATKKERVKAYVTGLKRTGDPLIIKLIRAQQHLTTDNSTGLEETDAKEIYKLVSGNKVVAYRNRQLNGRTLPEEILAEIVAFFDWYNSIDSMDTHPIIVAALTKARLEQIMPFETHNFIVSNLLAYSVLTKRHYDFKGYIYLEAWFDKTKRAYEDLLYPKGANDHDFTGWIEYFTEGMASQTKTMENKTRLLGKDTKLAKVSGIANLSERQAKVVEFLQDYGMIQNQNFSSLFPTVSEDSILRDLKKLVEMGIVVKRGKTKSSRYELG